MLIFFVEECAATEVLQGRVTFVKAEKWKIWVKTIISAFNWHEGSVRTVLWRTPKLGSSLHQRWHGCRTEWLVQRSTAHSHNRTCFHSLVVTIYNSTPTCHKKFSWYCSLSCVLSSTWRYRWHVCPAAGNIDVMQLELNWAQYCYEKLTLITR